MNAAETAVRDALATRGLDDVLPAALLLDRVRVGIAEDAGRRRRRAWTSALAAAACVALAVLASGTLRPFRDAGAPAASTPTSDGLQTVTDHGLSVRVPAQWPITLTAHCWPTDGDSVDLTRWAMTCPAVLGTPPARSGTTVAFGPALEPSGERVTVDGRVGWRSEVSLSSDPTLTDYALTVPDAGGSVSVITADPVAAQRILATVTVVGNDTVCGSVSALTAADLTETLTPPGPAVSQRTPMSGHSETVAEVQALAQTLCALPVNRDVASCLSPTLRTWTLVFQAGPDALPAVEFRQSGGCPASVSGLGTEPRDGRGVTGAISATFRLPSWSATPMG